MSARVALCPRGIAHASRGAVEAYEASMDPADEQPDLAAALCHQLKLPLEHVLERIQRALDALRARSVPRIDGATLKAMRYLADAHAATRHLLRIVDDVDSQAPVDARRMRRLDVRGVVRAAAAMVPELDVAVDAPDAAFVTGDDTRLVHAFTTLFAELADGERAIIARVRGIGDVVLVELWRDGAASAPPRRARDGGARAVGRSVVRHIVAAHGGRVERKPLAGADLLVRVRFPATVTSG